MLSIFKTKLENWSIGQKINPILNILQKYILGSYCLLTTKRFGCAKGTFGKSLWIHGFQTMLCAHKHSNCGGTSV